MIAGNWPFTKVRPVACPDFSLNRTPRERHLRAVRSAPASFVR